jgi:hypothetical protein
MRNPFKKAQRKQRFTLDNVSIPALEGWTETKRNDELIVAGSAGGRQQVTLSTIHFAEDPSLEAFEILCERRLEGERREFEDGFIEGGEPQAVGDGFVMVYSGGDKDSGRIFSGFLSLKLRELVTVYVESIGMSSEDHLQTFKTLVSGVVRA